MFEQIISIVKEAAGTAVAENNAVPEADKPAIAAEAVQSVTGGLQKALSGNLQDLSGLFSGNTAGNTFQDMLGGFVQNLKNNQGLSADTAQSLGNSIIPSILEKLKALIGNSGLDISSILGALGGKDSFLDLNKDGKVNLQDALGILGGNSQGEGKESGGLEDMIKGLFGK